MDLKSQIEEGFGATPLLQVSAQFEDFNRQTLKPLLRLVPFHSGILIDDSTEAGSVRYFFSLYHFQGDNSYSWTNVTT